MLEPLLTNKVQVRFGARSAEVTVHKVKQPFCAVDFLISFQAPQNEVTIAAVAARCKVKSGLRGQVDRPLNDQARLEMLEQVITEASATVPHLET